MRGSTIALLALLMVKMALGEAEQKSTTTQSTTTQSTTSQSTTTQSTETQSVTSGWGSWVTQGVGYFKQGIDSAKNYATGAIATAAPPDSDKSLLNRAGCALGNCALTVATTAYQGATEVANGLSESEAAKKLGEVKEAIIKELGSRINLEELMKHLDNPLVSAALMVFLKNYPAASIAHTFITSEQGKALLGLNKVAEEKKEGTTQPKKRK